MAGSLNKDGKKYASRSKNSIISYLLDEKSNNYRHQLELRGIKPKNHHKENLKHIEQIQKSLKQKQEEQQTNNIKHKIPAKYSKIDSKLQLKQTLNNKSKSSLSPKSKQTNFIQKNMTNIHLQSSLNSSLDKTTRSKNRKPAIPKRSDLNISNSQIVDKNKKDFVALNKTIKNNKSMLDKNNNKENQRFVNKKDYGKVPKYIIQRKLEKEELEMKRIEEEEANKIPKGMRKMSNDERLETLSILKENKSKVIESIKNLPLVIETPSMIRYQSKLNDNLKQIEETMKIFEKQTVFVALEE